MIPDIIKSIKYLVLVNYPGEKYIKKTYTFNNVRLFFWQDIKKFDIKKIKFKKFDFEHELAILYSSGTTLKTNFHFVVLYENLFSMVITAFAPITLLVFFNWNVYRFIHQKQNEIEENMRLIEESEVKSSPGRSSGSSTTFTFEPSLHKRQKQCEEQQRTSFFGSLKRQREKDKVQYQSQPSYAAERQRRKKKMKRNKNQTKILFIIIILFIFCHSLRCCLLYTSDAADE